SEPLRRTRARRFGAGAGPCAPQPSSDKDSWWSAFLLDASAAAHASTVDERAVISLQTQPRARGRTRSDAETNSSSSPVRAALGASQSALEPRGRRETQRGGALCSSTEKWPTWPRERKRKRR